MPRPSHPTAQTPARLRERPTWLIARAHGRAFGLLNEAFAAHGDGLRGYHYRLLAALDEGGPASQADLGRSVGLDRSDVTAAVADLEVRGLIERSVDPEHKRRNIVSITAAGADRLVLLDDVVTDVQTTLLAPLSPTQRRQFMTILHRLLES